MFGFFKDRKRKAEIKGEAATELVSTQKPNIEEKIYLKGTKISWHKNLIGEFTSEHKQLLDLFTAVSVAYERKEYTSVQQHLKDFKRNLIAHILKENILLYAYLKYFYAEDAINRELAKNMQKEMTAIGSVVFSFIQKMTETDAKFDDAFKKELDAIGTQLVQRIQIEENSLYDLYVHPKMVNA
jgi:iron-sulfur cluster repair protein YtfE (RIC family)